MYVDSLNGTGIKSAALDEPEQHEAETGDSEQASATIDAAEFARTVEAFGAEIAADVFANGGGYEQAQAKHYAALEAENEKLRNDNAELRAAAGKAGGTVAAPSDEPRKSAKLFNTGK